MTNQQSRIRNKAFLRVLCPLLFIALTLTAIAELPEEDKNSHLDMMTKALKLSSFINDIQTGKTSSNQTAILYEILENTHEVCIHQQNGAKENRVFVMKDGHREAVYDKNDELVQDGINDGSYNYYHPAKEPLYHFTFDISPWIMWGQSRTDSTTVKSRIYAYMGDLEGGIRRAREQQIKPAKQWKSNGQVQALAVFMRAIHEGKAENIFSLFESDTTITDEQLIDVLTCLNKGLETVYFTSDKN
jgi:hypothetical protein